MTGAKPEHCECGAPIIDGRVFHTLACPHLSAQGQREASDHHGIPVDDGEIGLSCECGCHFVVQATQPSYYCPRCGETVRPPAKKYERLRLLNRLAKLRSPECQSMVSALLKQDDTFAHEILDLYEATDDDARPDMLAFFDGDGPRRTGESKLKHEDGTPTSADLRKWAE